MVLMLAAAPVKAGHMGTRRRPSARSTSNGSRLSSPLKLSRSRTSTPPVEGRAAIGKAWGGLLTIPGIALTVAPTRIEVAESGDIAIDIGAYSLSFDDGNGDRVGDEGKYVVTWRKIDGEWKVTADIFNTNLSAP